MNVPPPASLNSSYSLPEPKVPSPPQSQDGEVQQQFQEILGELLFGQMLKSMRRTVGKPAYFHGGRGEEIFTQHLDQVLAQKISQSAGEQYLGQMYDNWSAGKT